MPSWAALVLPPQAPLLLVPLVVRVAEAQLRGVLLGLLPLLLEAAVAEQLLGVPQLAVGAPGPAAEA